MTVTELTPVRAETLAKPGNRGEPSDHDVLISLLQEADVDVYPAMQVIHHKQKILAAAKIRVWLQVATLAVSALVAGIAGVMIGTMFVLVAVIFMVVAGALAAWTLKEGVLWNYRTLEQYRKMPTKVVPRKVDAIVEAIESTSSKVSFGVEFTKIDPLLQVSFGTSAQYVAVWLKNRRNAPLVGQN